MRETVLSGTAWMMSVALIAKILTVGSQVVLGFLMPVGEFGIYAAVVGLTTYVLWMKNGAVQQLMIADKVNKVDVIGYEVYASAFNIISALGLLLMAFSRESVGYSSLVLLAFSVSQLISLPQLTIRSHHSSCGEYRKLSFYELFQSISRNAILVASAFIYPDVRCFAVSIVGVAIYDLIYYLIFISKEKSIIKGRVKKKDLVRIWTSGKWLLLGAVGSALVMQGAFLVINVWETDIVLGNFYFAFQLVTSFAIIVGEAVRKVFMPALAALNDESERFHLFDSSLRCCLIFLIPISIGSALAIGPLMEIIWGEKWIGAVFAAQMMCLTIFVSIAVLVCYAYLEAGGFWKQRNLLQVADGIILIPVISAAAIVGGLSVIVVVNSLRRLIFGVVQVYYAYRLSQKKWNELNKCFLICSIVSLLLFGLTIMLFEAMPNINWLRIFVAVVFTLASAVVLCAMLLPAAYMKKIKDYVN